MVRVHSNVNIHCVSQNGQLKELNSLEERNLWNHSGVSTHATSDVRALRNLNLVISSKKSEHDLYLIRFSARVDFGLGEIKCQVIYHTCKLFRETLDLISSSNKAMCDH